MMDLLQNKLPMFQWCAELSSFAYHPNGYAAEMRQWATDGDREWWPFSDPQTSTQGVVAIDHANKTIFFAWAGTNDKADWLSNFKIIKSRLGSIMVHRGVKRSVRANIIKINALLAHHPHYRFVTTGHSLGGMLALATGVYLQATRIERPARCVIVTFGAGKIAAAKDITRALAEYPIYQFINGSDLIPRRPFIPFAYGDHGGVNRHLIYFPNNQAKYGQYLIDPSEWRMRADRFLTFNERYLDHPQKHYRVQLSRVSR